jgi:Xaa-Pro dipeptidase
MEKPLVFSQNEFNERVKRAREFMRSRDLDLLMIHTPENIYYLSGYQTPGYYAYQCLFLPLDGEPCLLTRWLEQPNVRRHAWIEQCISWRDTEDPIKTTAEAIRTSGAERKRIGVEKSSWFFTIEQYERLKAFLPEAELLDASVQVNQLRIVKSAEEIRYIRQAAEIAVKGVRAALEALENARTDLDLARAVNDKLIREGSEFPGLPPFIATGSQSSVTHATWSGRDLRRGDCIFLEIPGCVNRYHAAYMRTAVIGKPSARWRSAEEAVADGLKAALAAIKPGVTSGEVDWACREITSRAGFSENHRHRVGYSIGIAFPPDWGEGHIMSIRPEDPTPLEAGMTFHLVPTVFFDGEAQIGFSETVLVTEEGCERLTQGLPLELHVVD